MNVNVLVDERHSYVVTRYRKESPGHFSLMERIKLSKEAIKASVAAEIWVDIEKLLDLLSLQNYQECKLMYTQGAMDCAELCHYLKTEYIHSDYME